MAKFYYEVMGIVSDIEANSYKDALDSIAMLLQMENKGWRVETACVDDYIDGGVELERCCPFGRPDKIVPVFLWKEGQGGQEIVHCGFYAIWEG